MSFLDWPHLLYTFKTLRQTTTLEIQACGKRGHLLQFKLGFLRLPIQTFTDPRPRLTDHLLTQGMKQQAYRFDLAHQEPEALIKTSEGPVKALRYCVAEWLLIHVQNLSQQLSFLTE